jgi:hypothetical protein
MTTQLPKVIATYIEASNKDVEAFLATFVEDALVNDAQREFWGAAAIRAWAEKELFGAKVTMDVVRIQVHYGDFIVTANLDGTFDKTGLPDPLLLTFYFTLKGDKIVKLIILLNKPVAR